MVSEFNPLVEADNLAQEFYNSHIFLGWVTGIDGFSARVHRDNSVIEEGPYVASFGLAPQLEINDVVLCVQAGNVIVITTKLAKSLESFVPAGLIGIWTGTIANIPTGWRVCDGTNGTPNLLDKFIKSVATGATNPGGTGGSLTHTHAQHAAHDAHTNHSNHILTLPSPHTVTWPSAHNGASLSLGNPDNSINLPAGAGSLAASVVHRHSISGSLGHTGGSISGHSGGGIDGHSGHSAHSAHSLHDSPTVEPPFYLVAFIMKT